MYKSKFKLAAVLVLLLAIPYTVGMRPVSAESKSVEACEEMVKGGLRSLPDDRLKRYLGKVRDDSTAFCRGGDSAVGYRETPWVDWSNYYATGDSASKVIGGYDAITSLGPGQVLTGIRYTRIRGISEVWKT